MWVARFFTSLLPDIHMVDYIVPEERTAFHAAGLSGGQ
jgi:hypothetical protein